VGNTDNQKIYDFNFWDHPHTCGEYRKV